MNAKLDVLRELLIEFLVVLGVFNHFTNHFEALLRDIFFDDFQNLIMLKEFS